MGIFTKKDTNTISGENKYKGWGNTKTKVFEDERQKAAVMEAAGGDLKGKDFRQYKRDVHQQKRLNRRALRRAERQGIDPSQVQMRKGEFKELDRREQDIEQYFKDVRKERVENAAEIAAVTAAVIATGGLAAGALAPATTTAAVPVATSAASTSATSKLLTALSTGTTASTAGTAAAQTLGQKAAEQAVKSGVKAAVNLGADAVKSGGAQGAMDTNDAQAQQIAQLQQQIARLQAIQSQPVPPQLVTPSPYQLPDEQVVPGFTAGDMYNPFFE